MYLIIRQIFIINLCKSLVLVYSFNVFQSHFFWTDFIRFTHNSVLDAFAFSLGCNSEPELLENPLFALLSQLYFVKFLQKVDIFALKNH